MVCYDYSFAINPTTLRQYVSQKETALEATHFYKEVRFYELGI